MIIMATFIGKPTLGYVTGHVYKLRVEGNSIIRFDQTGYCPYKNVKAFLRNWASIRVVNDAT
jgi:hypothetical protein